MIKFKITEEMIDFLKSLREEYNIKAIDLAEKIGKTGAYISKFDKGDYKNISLDDLNNMASKIIGDEKKGCEAVENFLNNYILNNEIYDTGLLTYDDVIRKIDIPSDLIEFIDMEIKENNFKISDIVKYINSNSDLPDFTKDIKYEYNIYYSFEDSEENNNIFIKVKLEESLVENILNKKVLKSNFLTIRSLVYSISRLKNVDKNLSILISESILSKYKFFNLKLEGFSLITEELKNNVKDELNQMPDQINNTIYHLISFICFIYKKDPYYSIRKVWGLRTNLNSDPSLFFALFNYPFFKMSELSFNNKSKFLKELNSLIKKYSKIQEDDKYQIY